jgi:hypothetical protein
MHAAAI